MVFWQQQHDFMAGRTCLAVHDRESPCLPAAMWPCGHIHAPRPHAARGTDGHTQSPCQPSPSHRAAHGPLQPHLEVGGGETKGPGATSWGRATGRAQQPPAQVHTTPRLGCERHRLTTWPRGAPFLCPLKARSLGTRTHDGHRTTCTTDPSRTEGPDWLHRTVDLAKKTTP